MQLSMHEDKLVKTNRLYLFLGQINQMILKEKDEKIIYQRACDIAVGTGKFRMAWIGLLDEESGRLMPAYYAGEEKGYLEKINITVLSG